MIDLVEFKKCLKIDKLALDDEVMQQASLLYEVSEALVEAIAKRDALKDNLAKLEAEIDQDLRTGFEESEIKYTEPKIKSLVLIDTARTKANTELLAAKTQADRLTALKEAFHQRGYMLRDLCSLYQANYFESSASRPNNQMSDAVYNQRRARLAESRKSRGD
jgi:hypothetical protein